MTSTFNLLTAGGARFDKSRFQNDMELFTAKPVKSSRKGKEKAAAASSSTVLPASLDFFHDHAHGAARDVEAEVSDDESDEDSEMEDEEDQPAPPQQKITLSGPDPLPKSLHANLPSLTSHETSPSSSRSGLPLLSALKASKITSLWGVQCAVGGCLLEGKDVMCIAPTGSGKTLSYLLPTLIRLRDPARGMKNPDEGRGVRAVVLVPTHDLAVQIHGVLKAVTRGRSWRSIVLAKATERAICESSPGSRFKSAKGKVSGDDEDDGETDGEDDDIPGNDDAMSTGSTDEFADDTQAEPTPTSLGIDILIATPERLHHLLDQKLLSLSSTRHLILDEADRLLSSDFKPQVLPILSAAKHPEVQKCFLSATMPSGSEVIAKKWLREGGVRVVVGVKDSAVSTVAQSLLYTGSESGKLMALRNLVAEGKLPYPSLIFVQSVQRAEELHNTLVLDGLRVESVHGNRTASQRDAAVAAFRKGEVFMLVVTEVLARGMDFRGVKVVVNYDFPQTVQSYIHRIGRTGRAGRPGTAITFFSNEDSPHLRTIANVLKTSGCPVPEYMLEMKKPSKNLKKFRAQVPVKRKEVGGGGRDVAKEMGKKRRDMVEASKRRKGREAVAGKRGKGGEGEGEGGKAE